MRKLALDPEPADMGVEDGREFNNVNSNLETGAPSTITRRMFARIISTLGIAVMAEGVTGGKISKILGSLLPDENLQNPASPQELDLFSKIEEQAKQAAEELAGDTEGMNDNEKMMMIVDYAGTILFAHGIYDLMQDCFPKAFGHINKYHYEVLTLLAAAKYSLSDETGRHHLRDEYKSSLKAFGIITGTIAMAEGIDMNVDQAQRRHSNATPATQDRIALMNCLANLLSPLATTVGSASILKKTSADIADGDKKIMAACVSHISNCSGFILFGDPPFIAIAEKYGFAEGVKWQMQTMWPLWLYSLVSATYKINVTRLKNTGLTAGALHKTAMRETFSGLFASVPVLTKIIGASLMNIGAYYGLGRQQLGGIQLSIGEVLSQKIQNLARLAYSDEFEGDPHHESHEGLIRESPEYRKPNEAVARICELLAAGMQDAPQSTEGRDERQRFFELIEEEDWDELRKLAQHHNIPGIDTYIQVLQEMHGEHVEEARKNNGDDTISTASTLNPFQMFRNLTSVSRQKSALGHNMADVVNVFPFQAGCVPFLLRAFKDAVRSLDALGMKESEKELVIFFLIMIFSMFADNYVGCKIGLELYPEKPEIGLIASIQGGSQTAIGNMANIAQFNLDTYSLRDSFQVLGMHWDNVLVSSCWMKAVEMFGKIGIFKTPTPHNQGGHHASNSAVTRRGLLGLPA